MKRMDLDLAISQAQREKIQLFGGGDDRKVTFFTDNLPDLQNYPAELVKAKKRDQLMR